jgi:hypothetical protein
MIIALLNGLVIGSFSFLIWKKADDAQRKFFWPAVVIKIVAGLSLGLIYKYYYTANDTFPFFEDAKVITAFAKNNLVHYVQFLWSADERFSIWSELVNVQSRSLFFIKILSFFNLLTDDNYWMSSVWFSFLSFLGCWHLFSRFTQWLKDAQWPAAFSFLFFPSFVFWGSGIVKESLAIGALCYILGVFLFLVQRQRPKILQWILIVIASWILWNLKYYWAAVLFPSMITSLILIYGVLPFMKFSNGIQIFMWAVVFLTVCLGVSFIHPNFYLDRLLEVVVENYDLFARVSRPDGMIHYDHLSATWSSMFLNSPWAIFSGLFRPFIFEPGNLLHLFSAIENGFLLLLFISSLTNLRSIPSSPYRLIIFGAIVYVLLLCALLALSTPNLGTLSRYRIGFLPVFLFLISYRNPLINKIPFFRN